MEPREEAFILFKESNGRLSSQKIADKLNVKLYQVKYWRSKDRWNDNLNKSRGAPKGHKNSVNNKGGGAPIGNLNNLRHGLYCGAKRFSNQEFLKKYLPKAKQNIINDIEENELNPIDILWGMIVDGYSDLLRSAKIMHVKNSKDITQILRKESYGENSHLEEYEIETALNKQATALKARSMQMQTLNNLIRQYDEMIHDSLGLATEEQKLRIEKLKGEISILNGIGYEEQKLRTDKLKHEINKMTTKESTNDGEIKEMLKGIVNEL